MGSKSNMTNADFRIGQIVPSSNTTMETEVPRLFGARGSVRPHERFTFHSSRMRMKKVTKEELAAMDADSDRCAAELSDARVDVMGYACLVAIMSMGPGYHRQSETRLHKVTRDNGGPAPIVTSAGALIEGLGVLGARKVSIITPYMKPLTDVVADYIEAENISVLDRISLEIEDNLAVGRRDPLALVDISKRLDVTGVDAVVISACVQMPSLEAVQRVEDALGKPVVSSAICTAYCMMRELGIDAIAPEAGALLSGRYAKGRAEVEA